MTSKAEPDIKPKLANVKMVIQLRKNPGLFIIQMIYKSLPTCSQPFLQRFMQESVYLINLTLVYKTE